MRGLPIRCTPEDKAAVLDTLSKALEVEQPVVFAYVYGSFLEDRPFHDIDVAVYLDATLEPKMGAYAAKLATSLEKSLAHVLVGGKRINGGISLPVDLRVLNQAPLGFRYHVFRGRLLFSRDAALQTQEVERTVSRYLDLEPLRRRGLKEAMTTWS
jgi:predicted nucleotidyltransferase